MKDRELEWQRCLAVTGPSEPSSSSRAPQGSESNGSTPEEEDGSEAREVETKEETQDSETSGNWGPKSIQDKLRIIHSNLGHPSNAVLVRMLRDAKASEEMIKKAQEYQCPQCARRGHANPHRTAQIPQATRKWEVVSVDTFWWHSPHKDEKGNPIEHVIGVSWLDEASDFHTATILRSGNNEGI